VCVCVCVCILYVYIFCTQSHLRAEAAEAASEAEKQLQTFPENVGGGKASRKQPQETKLNYSQKYFKDVPPDLHYHGQVKR
jgi:hypothetical protein